MENATLTLMGEGAALRFEGFFQAEYPGLVRSLYLVTVDLAEAEELAQEAMARVFERWDRVRVMQSPSGYAYRTAVNLNRKRLRHLAVRVRRLPAMSSPVEHESSAEAGVDFAAALASLPVGQREALMLTEWLGLSAEEAGSMLGVAASSVRSRVHRARETLRGLLELRSEDG